jgi:hypothetical protein
VGQATLHAATAEEHGDTPLNADARIWVKEANIDALKLVFNYAVPRQFVRTVAVMVKPARRTEVAIGANWQCVSIRSVRDLRLSRCKNLGI